MKINYKYIKMADLHQSYLILRIDTFGSSKLIYISSSAMNLIRVGKADLSIFYSYNIIHLNLLRIK